MALIKTHLDGSYRYGNISDIVYVKASNELRAILSVYNRPKDFQDKYNQYTKLSKQIESLRGTIEQDNKDEITAQIIQLKEKQRALGIPEIEEPEFTVPVKVQGPYLDKKKDNKDYNLFAIAYDYAKSLPLLSEWEDA